MSNRDGVILDIGCGTGRLLSLCKELNRDVTLIGTDLRFRMHKKIGDFFILADAENIPIKDKSINFVICSELLEHLPKPDSCFSEMSRILKEGGTLYITTPNKREIFTHGAGNFIRKTLKMFRVYDRLLRYGVKRGWFTQSSYLLTKLNQEHALHISEMDFEEIMRYLNKYNFKIMRIYDRPLNFSFFSPFSRFRITMELYKFLDSLNLLKPCKHIAVLCRKVDKNGI